MLPKKMEEILQNLSLGKTCLLAAFSSVYVSSVVNVASADSIAPVTQYTIPTPFSGPCNMVEGPDGQMWVAEVLAHKIARIDVWTGGISEYNIPNTITVPPQPNLPLLGIYGLTLLNPVLQTLSGSSVFLPFPASFECGINNGPDGNIWFTNAVSNLFGNINPTTHLVTTFAVPTLGSNVEDIVGGPDNAMWFAEPASSKIGRFDLATGAITEYQLPNPAAAPIGVFSASDGGIWFPEFVGNKIGRIDIKTKAITEFPLPTPAATPFVLRAETTNGVLWFSEFTGNKIGSISMKTGAIRNIPYRPQRAGLCRLRLDQTEISTLTNPWLTKLPN